MSISFTSLLAQLSESTILARGLELAQAVGLRPTTWRVGDPTRSLYKFLAGVLAQREAITAQFVRSAVLSTAQGEWLTIVAREVYGVERETATYVATSITVANASGAHYYFGPRDVTFKCSTTGATYQNVGDFSLVGPDSTATIGVIAVDPGSDSDVGTDEIDTVVTSLDGVTVTASTAAYAVDEQTDESLREQCRLTLGALSPNGPQDAYAYVATNSTLTGTTAVTKAKAAEDSATGQVTVRIVGTPESVALVQAAVMRWAKPMCVTPTVSLCDSVAVAITATVTGTDMPGDLDARVEAALAALLESNDYPIGARISVAAVTSLIYATAFDAGATGISVNLSVPSADITTTDAEYLVPGNVVISEVER